MLSFNQIKGGHKLVDDVANAMNKTDVVTMVQVGVNAPADDKIMSEAVAEQRFTELQEAVSVRHVVDKVTLTNEATTEFVLDGVPTDDKVTFSVNGVNYADGKHFTVDRGAQKVTWTYTAANGGFDLVADIADSVKIAYTTRSEADAPNKLAKMYPENYQTMTTVPDDLDLSKTPNASKLFDGCEALMTVPDDLDTSSVTNMAGMFNYCVSLESVPQLDTSNVINMAGMFNNCESLESVATLNTSSVTKMSSMFEGCTSLPAEFPWTIDCASVTNVNNIKSMFADSSVTKVKLANVRSGLKQQITSQLLKGDDTLEIEFVDLMHMNNTISTMKDIVDLDTCRTMTEVPAELDTSTMTSTSHMFDDCEALVSVPELDTHNVTSMDYMFADCASLTAVPEMDTSKVTDMSNMFENCSSLPATLPMVVDCSSVADADNLSNMLRNSSVTKVYLYNVNYTLKASITSAKLKGDNSLEVVFTQSTTSKFYTLTLAGTTNQTVTLMYTEPGVATVTKTSTGANQAFTVQHGTTWTAIVAGAEGYNPGTLFANSGTVTGNTTVSASEATVAIIVLTDSNYKMSQVYPSAYQTMTTVPDLLDTSNVTNMTGMFSGCSSLTTVPELDTSNVWFFNSMFSGCSSLPAAFPYTIDCRSAQDYAFFAGMFRNSSVTSVTLKVKKGVKKNLITPKLLTGDNNSNLTINFIDVISTIVLTNEKHVLHGKIYSEDYAESITEVFDTLDCTNLTNMEYMFNWCACLTTIPQLDTSAVTNMEGMFQMCYSLPAIFPWVIDCSSITDENSMWNMFTDSSVTSVTLANVNDSIKSSITSQLLKGDNTLTINFAKLLSSPRYYRIKDVYPDTYDTMTTVPDILDTSNLTNMQQMFIECTNLTTIPQLDTSNIDNMNQMFTDCTSLTIVPQMDTSNVETMSWMFMNCPSLPAIFPWIIDCSSITAWYCMISMFSGSSVTSVTLANVDNSIKPEITSQLLRDDDTLTITFV